MYDNKYAPATVELLTKTMNELARAIGAMDPDDPKRAPCLKDLSDLTQFRIWLTAARDELIGQRMDELARETTTLKSGDPRRAEIVCEIMQLIDLLKRNRGD